MFGLSEVFFFNVSSVGGLKRFDRLQDGAALRLEGLWGPRVDWRLGVGPDGFLCLLLTTPRLLRESHAAVSGVHRPGLVSCPGEEIAVLPLLNGCV